MLGPERKYAKRSWYYPYRSIPNECQESDIATVCASLLKQAASVTKQWSDKKNSEWIVRIYFAAKMILSSSVMAQSMEYAQRKNLRVVTSYLEYYTVLNTLRAILLTNPSVAWDDGALLKTTHSKIINVSVQILKSFNKGIAEKTRLHIEHLKAFRELISYRAPTKGDSFLKADVDVLASSRLFAEVAQMQSELLEASVQKKVSGKYDLLEDAITQICHVEIDGVDFFDEEDNYRLGYLRRKHPTPTNVLHVMSEGHVEDFFGSWTNHEDDKDEDEFDPDANWRILFDVP